MPDAMRKALDAASEAAVKGEVPIGAVVVRAKNGESEVLAVAANRAGLPATPAISDPKRTIDRTPQRRPLRRPEGLFPYYSLPCLL